jgi:hypothetical protein
VYQTSNVTGVYAKWRKGQIFREWIRWLATSCRNTRVNLKVKPIEVRNKEQRRMSEGKKSSGQAGLEMRGGAGIAKKFDDNLDSAVLSLIGVVWAVS